MSKKTTRLLPITLESFEWDSLEGDAGEASTPEALGAAASDLVSFAIEDLGYPEGSELPRVLAAHQQPAEEPQAAPDIVLPDALQIRDSRGRLLLRVSLQGDLELSCSEEEAREAIKAVWPALRADAEGRPNGALQGFQLKGLLA